MVDRVEPDVPVTTDVGVEYLGDEAHDRWPHGITETHRKVFSSLFSNSILKCHSVFEIKGALGTFNSAVGRTILELCVNCARFFSSLKYLGIGGCIDRFLGAQFQKLCAKGSGTLI